MLIGDSAGFLNGQRLKGIHLAMKSGMLAAETISQALEACSQYQDRGKTKYFAAKVLKSDKVVTVLQMAPGQGKTWVCILIAAYVLQ